MHVFFASEGIERVRKHYCRCVGVCKRAVFFEEAAPVCKWQARTDAMRCGRQHAYVCAMVPVMLSKMTMPGEEEKKKIKSNAMTVSVYPDPCPSLAALISSASPAWISINASSYAIVKESGMNAVLGRPQP